MAKAEYAMSYDGVFYKKGEELPDLGSWECVECNGMKRDYEGLSKDLGKLPHYVTLVRLLFVLTRRSFMSSTRERILGIDLDRRL